MTGKKIEIIDGVEGVWLSVNKPEDVKIGQRIRYWRDIDGQTSRYGFSECLPECRERIFSEGQESMFESDFWTGIEAWFPGPADGGLDEREKAIALAAIKMHNEFQSSRFVPDYNLQDPVLSMDTMRRIRDLIIYPETKKVKNEDKL
jgi:hypothetical protein